MSSLTESLRSAASEVVVLSVSTVTFLVGDIYLFFPDYCFSGDVIEEDGLLVVAYWAYAVLNLLASIFRPRDIVLSSF